MLASEPDLASRVTAAVQVGGRRWNLRIDNSIDVLLPCGRPSRRHGPISPACNDRAPFLSATFRRSTCVCPTGSSCVSPQNRQRKPRQPRKDACRRRIHDRDRRGADARNRPEGDRDNRKAQGAKASRAGRRDRPNHIIGRTAAWSQRSISAPPKCAASSPGSSPRNRRSSASDIKFRAACATARSSISKRPAPRSSTRCTPPRKWPRKRSSRW